MSCRYSFSGTSIKFTINLFTSSICIKVTLFRCKFLTILLKLITISVFAIFSIEEITFIAYTFGRIKF